MNISQIFIILMMLPFLVSCGKSQVQGKVEDPFGNGLDSVTVEIEKSAFKATTDATGNYAIEYVPGSFSIKYSKPGYTTHHVELNLQEKSEFPAQTVSMLPIPKDKGLYYLAKKGLIKMTGGKVNMEEKEAGPGYQSYVKHRIFSAPFYGSLVIPEGTTVFINTTGRKLGLSEIYEMREGRNSSPVLDDSFVGINITGENVIKNGFGVIDEAKFGLASVGDENIPVIKFNVNSGHYALGGATYILINERLIPDQESVFYPFQVSSDAKLVNAEPDMDNDTRGHLETAVAEFIRLVEARNYSLLIRRYSADWFFLITNPMDFIVKEAMSTRKDDEMQELIKELKNAKPVMMSDDEAVYNLKNDSVKFKKVGGRWCWAAL